MTWTGPEPLPAGDPGAAPPRRRFYSDGRGIWYIDGIWALAADLPVSDVAIAGIGQLDEVCWFSDAWGVRPTPRAVVDHCRRILEADARYPVIFGPGGVVLDGVHRICAALLRGESTIRAVRLDVLPPPDEEIPVGDPRRE